MTPVNVVRAAMLSSVLMLLVGSVVQLGGVGNDQLFQGLLYGAIALLSGATMVSGYATGRWPQPGQHDPAARSRTAHSVAWGALFLILMLAARVLLDGASLGDAVTWLATGYLRFAGFPLAAWLVGYLVGRMLRNGQAPSGA